MRPTRGVPRVTTSPGRRAAACCQIGSPNCVGKRSRSHRRPARRVALGEMVCSAGMGDKLFHHLRSIALRNSGGAAGPVLTIRQQHILQLINEGLSNKQIAQRLSLGISTVKNHVHGLLGRLQVGRRSDAVARLGRPMGRIDCMGALYGAAHTLLLKRGRHLGACVPRALSGSMARPPCKSAQNAHLAPRGVLAEMAAFVPKRSAAMRVRAFSCRRARSRSGTGAAYPCGYPCSC
jgi:DNA-binding CsgD family transcriptional regulator